MMPLPHLRTLGSLLLLCLATFSACSSPPKSDDAGACEADETPAPGAVDRFVFEDTASGQKGYRRADGSVVIPAKYVVAYEFSAGGVASVVDGTTPFLFIDTTGRTLATAYAFDNGPDYVKEGLVRIVAGGKVGFMSDSGRIVIPPRFDRAGSFCRGRAEVLVGTDTFMIDRTGRRVAPSAQSGTQGHISHAVPARPDGSTSLVERASLTIKAGDFHHSSAESTAGGDCAVRGSVLGLAGGKRDVTVLVFTDAQMISWLNTPAPRESAAALYRSARTSEVTFSVPLSSPDAYHLVISNMFSTSTDKTVQVSAELTCRGKAPPG